jgi:hypothetical protein
MELNEVGGRNLRSRWSVDLPPVRCARRHAGFYLTWMRPAVFAGSLVTVDSAGLRRKVSDVGGQLVPPEHVSTLDLTLSIGGAIAFEQDAAPRREAMISLKCSMMALVANITIALVPVLVFLAVVAMDSFKLARPVGHTAMCWGAVAALLPVSRR